ncbi:MAG: hypothetical protein J6K61_02805 [Clostridia bacterium]|nr:hypothetical protein [Clostridia bacterium]
MALGRLRGYMFSGVYADGATAAQRSNSIIFGVYDEVTTSDDWGATNIRANIYGWENGLNVYKNGTANERDTGVVSFTVNLTTSGSTYKYSFMKNGAVIKPAQGDNSVSIEDADANVENYGNFYLFNNMSPSVYSVRLYTAPLTEAERVQNHFADLVAFYELDLSEFDKDADNTLIYKMMAAVTLDETNYDAAKATAQLKLDELLAGSTFQYSKLYVGADGSETENGGKLTVLLVSFESESSAGTGSWYNIAPNATQDATFTGSWTKMGKGGIGHNVASLSDTALKFLDSSILPIDNYTIEMVASVRGYTQNADGVTEIYGGTHCRAGIALGRLRGYFMSGHTASDPKFHDKNLMIMLSDKFHANDNWDNTIIENRWTNMLTVYKGEYGIVNFGINLSTSDDTYYYRFFKNGAAMAPSSYSSIADADPNADFQGRFTLFDCMAPTAYAVRLYDATLTETERQQNHFIDVAAFYGLDLSAFKEMDAETKQFTYGLFRNVELDEKNYDAAKEEAQELLSIASMEITLNDYDKMMVGADGSATANGGHLTALFTAYNADNTLNLDKGLWIDKVHKNTAYFEGDLWQAVAGGGVGYVVTAGPKGEELGNGFYAVDTTSPYYTIDEAANDQFLRLPNSLLVGTLDYTLDVVAKVDTKFYFTDAEGNLTDEVYVNANQFVYYTATYTDEEGNPVSVENIRIASDLFEDGVAYWVTYQMGTENYARDVYNYNSETGEVGTRILFAQGAATNLTKIPDKTLVTFTETSKVYERASVFGGSDDRFFAIGIMTAYANFQNDGSWKQGTTLSYVQRVCLTLNNNTWNSTRFANGSWDDSNGRVLYDGVLHSMSYVRDIEGENQTYNIYKDGKTHFANETVFTTTTTSFPLENETTEFYLFNKTPVNVYAIRMYDVLLTAEEKAQNKAADICAYYQLDVHAYLEGTDADKAVVIEGLADAIFDEENYAAKKAEYQAVIDTIDPYKESGKPTYGGIVDGATYYVSTGFTAADPHPGILDKVEIKVGDGEYEVIEAPYTFAGNANITYTIRITDVAGNETIVTVHVKPIATLGEAIADLTVDNVKSSDKATIEAVVASITLDLTYATDDEKAALKEISDKCVALLAEIDATLAEKVRIETAVGLYTEATVKSSDSEALAQLKADIAALIATGQLTADEEAQISALITTIDALNARIAAIAEEIQRIETAIGAYTEETVKSSDTEALAQLKADIAALIATGQLTAEEVEAVGALDDSIDALVAKIDAILAEIARIEGAVGSYTNANVKSSDSEALAQLKADIAALIATNQLIAAEVEVVNALDETIDARVARIAAVADEVERITEESAAFDAATVKVSDEAAVSALTVSIMPLINNLTDEEIAEFGPVSQKLMACKARITAVKEDLAAIEAALGELTVGTVNSDAKDALVDAIAKIDALVATDNVTADEKTALGTDKATAEALVAKIDDVKTKLDAIIAGVASYAEATVKSSDKAAITALKAGIMPLMANLTEAEIGTLVGATQKLNALVAKIDAVTAEYTRIKDAVANAETAKADLEALVIDAYELLATTNLTDAEKTEITAKKNAINVLIASLEVGALGDADADFDGAVKDSFDNAANATLNEAIQDAIEAGKEITTHIVVGKVDAADVQDDNDKIVAFLGGKGNLVQLYDYTIVVKADGVVLGEISALDEGLKLKIAIPEELLEGRRVFKVVRVHNGVVEELETEVIDGVAYFESDAFSTYALTYKDKMPIIAIIGIVVGCVAVVGIAGFFIFRKGGKKEEGQEG